MEVERGVLEQIVRRYYSTKRKAFALLTKIYRTADMGVEGWSRLLRS
jgi:hypothetical protein